MAPDHAASPDWQNLGKRLRDSRGSRRALDIYEATGVAPNTITAWEKGRNHEMSPALYKLVEFYGWPAGALDRVLAGGQPRETEVPAFPISEDEVRALVVKLLDAPGLSERDHELLRLLQAQARVTRP